MFICIYDSIYIPTDGRTDIVLFCIEDSWTSLENSTVKSIVGYSREEGAELLSEEGAGMWTEVGVLYQLINKN